MRIFKYFAAANMAYGAIRVRREGGDGFEITGDETEEELDGLLADFAGENPFGRRELGGEDMLDPRKFRQWKLMVMFLQPDQTRAWKDFQSYGCHCIPEGRRRIGVAGFGEPVDPIDNACRSFHQCYRCLEDEHADEPNGCDGERTRYRFAANKSADGTKVITCKHPEGSCEYNVCQCDLQIAQRLSTAGLSWDMQYSKKQGKFDRETSCKKTGKGGAVFEECCGTKFTFPNNSIKRSNQCCDGTESKPLSQC